MTQVKLYQTSVLSSQDYKIEPLYDMVQCITSLFPLNININIMMLNHPSLLATVKKKQFCLCAPAMSMTVCVSFSFLHSSVSIVYSGSQNAYMSRTAA